MLDPLAVFLGNAITARGLTPIPLISTDHEVALAAGLAVVTTHRLFRNSEKANIEAVLTFPVPVHATLFDLTAETDGRLLHAKAQARSQAREVYEDAVTRGKSAVLHEELLKGIHMVSVANIQPGGEIKVTTKWAIPLSVAAGRSTLRIPQTLGDVYGRSGLSDADDLLTGGPAQPVIVSIQSEGQVEVVGAQLVGGRVTVSSADPIDLVVSLWEAVPIMGRDTRGRGVSLTLTPQLEGEVALNVAVLVDHSGSMADKATSRGSFSAHDAARNGITSLSNELAVGDNVDLWEFDTQVRQVGMAKAEASDFRAARERLALLAALLSPPHGGTEIGGALDVVIRSSKASDILLLTDGLSHQLNIDELARCGRRISVVLIGAGSLEARIGHLAAQTGGDLFIATADDLADVMSAAIGALRRPAIALPTVTDLPDNIRCVRNNVEIRASWAQVPADEASSEFSKATTAVAASLVVNCAPPEIATQYAVSEGIVSHLTSLVLIDEAGDTQSELPTMRKIALPGSTSVNSIPASAAFDLGALYDLASPSVGSGRYANLSASMDRLSSSPPTPARSVRYANKSMSRASSARPDTLQIVRLINWGDNPERLMGGDFSGLHPEVQRLLNELSGADQVRRLSDRYGLPSDIVAIALLANFASDEDRRAGRIWSAIFNRICDDLTNGMRRGLMKPLQPFFGEIEGRLSGLVGELASSVYGDLEQLMMEVATKTQSRCLAIIRELEAEAEHKLESLICARVEEAEQEFFRASQLLED
jgi:hypothetical protein